MNATTVKSRRTGAIGGMLVGSSVISARKPPAARARPSIAPSSDSTTLSVSSCRTRRSGAAPIAVRTAISRSRASPRTRSRFATLAHAINNRKPTAPVSSHIAGRTPPRISSSSGTANAVNFIAAGYEPCSVSRAAIARSSSVADAAVCPGASTAAPNRPWLRSRFCSSICSGRQSCVGSAASEVKSVGRRNPSGMTPITSTGTSLIINVRPMIDGSAL